MKKRSSGLKFPLKEKYLIMLAPSFVSEFDYPLFISQLRALGFDKVVEITFGAKMVNREYHKILKSSKGLKISSTCPGIVEFIKKNFLHYKKNLVKVDSPMVAMAKICRKVYPTHKIVFLSPCNFKRKEAKSSGFIDFVIGFNDLADVLKKRRVSIGKGKNKFNRFYNDYTKIYPLSGGLTKTAHLKGILKKKEVKIVDGVVHVKKFLESVPEDIRFLDCTFCDGGCIGGPLVNSKRSLKERKGRVLDYLELSKREDIPDSRKGVIKQAEGINFRKKGF